MGKKGLIWLPGDPVDHKQCKLLMFVKDHSFFDPVLPFAEESGWWLPGHGSSYPDCGSIKALGCENVGQHPGGKVFGRYYRSRCGRKGCPICFEGWAASQAERGSRRIASYVVGSTFVDRLTRKAFKETRKEPRRVFHETLILELESILKRSKPKVVHIVASPPQDSNFDRDHYSKLRKKATRIVKNRGLQGAASIFHPYRLHCRECDISIPDYQKTCLKCGGSNFAWVKSPHFHYIGVGWLDLEKVKRGFKRDGWVVKGFGVRKSVFWTFQYLLSHAGVFVDKAGFDKKRFHVVTWLGVLSYHRLFVAPMKLLPEICPHCGRSLQPLLWIGGLDRPPPEFDRGIPDFLVEGVFARISHGE